MVQCVVLSDVGLDKSISELEYPSLRNHRHECIYLLIIHTQAESVVLCGYGYGFYVKV